MIFFFFFIIGVFAAFILVGLWFSAALLIGFPAPTGDQCNGVLIGVVCLSQVGAAALFVFES
jgi:phosphate/sulfate permease